MSEDNDIKKINVPILRFREFHTPWRQTTIGNEGWFYYGKGAPKTTIVPDGLTPCVRYGELYSTYGAYIKKVVSKTCVAPENLKLSKGGEVLVPRVGENPLDFSKCSYLPFSSVAIGEMISVYNTDNNPLFVCYYFNRLRKEFARVVEGGNVSNLYFRYLEPISVRWPERKEQNKIAANIQNVDEYIQGLTKKKELLEQYKKGVMQKLFSQQIRFTQDDGTPFPDWEEKELGTISLRPGNRNIDEKIFDVLTNSATDGIVNQQDYFDKDIAVQGNLGNYHIVEVDDFIYNPRISSSAPVGPFNRNNLKRGVMSPLYTVLKFTEGDLDYLEYYFATSFWHRYMHSIANFGARHDRMNVTVVDFAKMPIPFPHPDEQKKIADFLSSIDDKINAVRDQLDMAKTFKTCLLQKMFV